MSRATAAFGPVSSQHISGFSRSGSTPRSPSSVWCDLASELDISRGVML